MLSCAEFEPAAYVENIQGRRGYSHRGRARESGKRCKGERMRKHKCNRRKIVVNQHSRNKTNMDMLLYTGKSILIATEINNLGKQHSGAVNINYKKA